MSTLNNLISKLILFFITGLCFIPFIINSNLGTLPLHTNFIQNSISIGLLILITTIALLQIYLLKSLKIAHNVFYFWYLIIFLGIQFAIIKPSYTAPYLEPASVLFLLSFAILAIQNSQISLSRILFCIALGILINTYWQIIFATLQLVHYHLDYKILFYGFDQQYYMLGNFFKFNNDSRITGGIGQHNNFADILSWGILANLYLFHKPNKLQTIIFWTNLIIISIFVARAESRTAYFYPIILMIYGLYLWRYKITPDTQKYLRKLIISCGIMLVILLIYHILEKNHLIHQVNYNNSNPFDNPETRESLRSMSVNERFTMWGRAWMMFIQHPLLGVGWNQYLQYFLITQTPSLIPNIVGELAVFENCHNLILQLLATTGIVGTSLFVLLIGYLIWNLARQKLETQILPLGIGLIVLTHSMFEYPLFHMPVKS